MNSTLHDNRSDTRIISTRIISTNGYLSTAEKRIKTENVQDSTSQKIFDLEKLVFTRISQRALVMIFGLGMRYYLRVRVG